MCFHPYNIIFGPLDAEIEIDFETNGFFDISVSFYCIDLNTLYRANKEPCERPIFFEKLFFRISIIFFWGVR